MAKIQLNETDSLDLQLKGYQFPDSTDKEYDGNWLNVYLKVDSKIGKWVSVEPCLLTREVKSIVEWIKSATRGPLSKDSFMTFMEPNLEFMISPMGNDVVLFKVQFELGCQPKGWDPNKDCFIQGKVEMRALARFGAELEMEFEKYPVRK